MPGLAGWYADPSGNGQRYFDGLEWTEHTAPALSNAQRTTVLDAAVAHGISLGARVESRSAFQAVLNYGGGMTGSAHVVMALLTIFTCGLFGIVWIIAMGAKDRRVILTVDACGNVVAA